MVICSVNGRRDREDLSPVRSMKRRETMKKKEEEEEEEKGRRERARVRRQREEEWRERRGEEARQRVIELENQSTRVASRRARCLTALDPRSRVLEFIVLEELTSPLMLATLLALPRSGSNRYTLRRRGEKYLPKYPRRSRWRRWRFFGILLPAPFCLFPRSRTTEHRRNEFSLLLYRQSRAPRLFLFCRLHVITVSRRRDPPRITHQRQIGELDNNYDWERLRRNAVTINIKKHCVDETQADHRSPFRSGRRTRRKEEEYIHIYIYVYV